MTYVERIECWRSGQQVTDGTPVLCEPGDFPEVHYDLARIAKEFDRDRIKEGPASLWRYWPLLSAENPDDAVTLGEGWTPILNAANLGRHIGCPQLTIKDEGRNPSGTFKDRGATVAVTRLRELGIKTIVHNSSGNAAGAWAMYTARAGIKCVNLLPTDATMPSLLQSGLCGADTVLLDGPWHLSGGMVADAVKKHGWFNIGTFKEPHRLEGKKTMGLEIAEQMGWQMPDAIVYPTGGGLGAVGIYKAFRELIELGWLPKAPLPKLIVAQYTGCAPIVKAYREGADHAETWTELDVPPGGLKSARPPGDQMVLKLIRETGGTGITVDTDEAIDAVADAARLEGLFPCPEAGTTVAALRKALAAKVIDKDDRVLLMFTGSGLKSIPVLPTPETRTVRPGDSL
jgi:threonine synthase